MSTSDQDQPMRVTRLQSRNAPNAWDINRQLKAHAFETSLRRGRERSKHRSISGTASRPQSRQRHDDTASIDFRSLFALTILLALLIPWSGSLWNTSTVAFKLARWRVSAISKESITQLGPALKQQVCKIPIVSGYFTCEEAITIRNAIPSGIKALAENPNAIDEGLSYLSGLKDEAYVFGEWRHGGPLLRILIEQTAYAFRQYDADLGNFLSQIWHDSATLIDSCENLDYGGQNNSYVACRAPTIRKLDDWSETLQALQHNLDELEKLHASLLKEVNAILAIQEKQKLWEGLKFLIGLSKRQNTAEKSNMMFYALRQIANVLQAMRNSVQNSQNLFETAETGITAGDPPKLLSMLRLRGELDEEILGALKESVNLAQMTLNQRKFGRPHELENDFC